MPELPEVETVRLQLLDKIINKKINGVEAFHDKTVNYDETFEDRLVGKTIEHVARVGKLLIVSFKKDSNLFLLIHLKMTGQLIFVDERGAIEIDPKKQDDNYEQCSICYVPNEERHSCPCCKNEFTMCNACMPLMDDCCSKFCRNKLRMRNSQDSSSSIKV